MVQGTPGMNDAKIRFNFISKQNTWLEPNLDVQ